MAVAWSVRYSTFSGSSAINRSSSAISQGLRCTRTGYYPSGRKTTFTVEAGSCEVRFRPNCPGRLLTLSIPLLQCRAFTVSADDPATDSGTVLTMDRAGFAQGDHLVGLPVISRCFPQRHRSNADKRPSYLGTLPVPLEGPAHRRDQLPVAAFA